MSKRFIAFSVLALGLLVLMTGTAWADSVPIVNASFESYNTLNYACASQYGPNCAFNANVGIPGWDVTNGGSFQPSLITQTNPYNGQFYSIPDGSIVAYANGGSISQTLTSMALSDEAYTLSVFVGSRSDHNAGSFVLSLDTILNGTITGTVCSVSGDAMTFATGTWVDETCTGTPTTAGNLYLNFEKISGQLDVDNASLNYSPTSVPEPGSASMLGFGALFLLGVFFFARKKQISLIA